MNVSAVKSMNYEQITMNNANKNKPNSNPNKLEAKRRSLRVSFSESSNRGPIKSNFKRYLAKMGHHEAVKCVDTPPQFTLNLIKSSEAEK